MVKRNKKLCTMLACAAICLGVGGMGSVSYNTTSAYASETESVVWYGTEENRTEDNRYLINDIYVEVVNNDSIQSAVITGHGSSVPSDLVIPDAVNIDGQEYPITKIALCAFNAVENLTSVSIPDTVTEIGGAAFSGCTNLTSLKLPNNLEIIENCAFENCTSLTGELVFPEDLTKIGVSAFRNCPKVTSVKMPTNLPEIGEDAFGSCNDNVVFTIKNTRQGGFNEAKYLKHVVIDEGATEIAQMTFLECSNLTDVTIPDTVTKIGASAFAHCTNLTAVNLPSSIKIIEDCAFEDTGLTGELVFQKDAKIEKIGGSAFYGCSNLTSVQMPKVFPKSIGKEAFGGGNGNLLFKIMKTTGSTFSGAGYVRHVVIEGDIEGQDSTCKEVIDYSFVKCEELRDVVLPDWFTKIKKGAFGGCKMLTNINFPSSLKVIENNAFEYCTSLTSLNLPDGLEKIGDGAFAKCTSLNGIKLKLPTSLTEIGSGVLGDCGNIEFIGNMSTLAKVGHSNSLKHVIIENDGVTRIDDCAFENNAGLQTIIIPDSVTEIGGCAFKNCSALTNITIPSNVTKIESNAFEGCLSLQTIEIPDSVTEIGSNAFARNNNLIINVTSQSVKNALINSGVSENQINLIENM